jgi:hypothetical protein
MTGFADNITVAITVCYYDNLIPVFAPQKE